MISLSHFQHSACKVITSSIDKAQYYFFFSIKTIMVPKHFLSIVPFENSFLKTTFLFLKKVLCLKCLSICYFIFSRSKIIRVSSHTFSLEGWSPKKATESQAHCQFQCLSKT